jgi:hypothetical protein
MTRTAALLFALAAAGCGTSGASPCAADPSLCQDAGPEPGPCTGQCIPLPEGWGPPDLLWFGPDGTTPPPCPAMPSTYAILGYADEPPTATCAPCTCSTSNGPCTLSSMMTASTAPCPGNGTPGIPFDAPDTWDGSCTAMDAIPSAASLTVSPPSLTDTCSPSSAAPIALAGKTRGEACQDLDNVEIETCPNAADHCALPEVEGFSLCVGGGEGPCPDGWPNMRLLFFDVSECGCACGAPMGSRCSSTLSLYADGACSELLGSSTISSDEEGGCIDATPGSPFGSKSATPPLYQSGTCTPSQVPPSPVTLCCQG